MTANGNSLVVLYRVVNSPSDTDELFNAFTMPRGPKGPTLAAVKQHCVALHALNHLGPEGFHWRVCVEDKPAQQQQQQQQGGSSERTFGWWDIQDENATLPIKEATQSQLRKFFTPPVSAGSGKHHASAAETATKAATGAFKSLGMAVTHAVGAGGDSSDHAGPPVGVVAFKLLDLVKMHDEFAAKHGSAIAGGRSTGGRMSISEHGGHHHHHHRKSSGTSMPLHTPAQPSHVQHQQPHRPQQSLHEQQQQPGGAARPAPSQQQAPTGRPPAAGRGGPQPGTAGRSAAPPPPPPADANLMDFGTPVQTGPNFRQGSTSSISSVSSSVASSHRDSLTVSKAEKLKAQYAKNLQKGNLVWDPIDERFVDPSTLEGKAGGGGGAGGMSMKGAGFGRSDSIDSGDKKNIKGVSIEASLANAANKSRGVQHAVAQRHNEMRESQAKALQEIRSREMKKKTDEAEEDVVRKKLEPIIKAWSEEHGKKKQLRALLASLHTILWPEAQWKQVSIGDLLDDKKVKLCFHKASRVVHPDKTHHLNAEQRFLAKRVFDALCQAKVEYDESSK